MFRKGTNASLADRWLVMPEVDEGDDGAYRELIARIARGQRIRGHAL